MDRQICINECSRVQNLSGIGRHYLNIVQHCSRSCAGCLAAAPIAEEGYAEIGTISRVSKWMLKMNYGNSCLKIDISGGDPMLHPELEKICEILRGDHPAARIFVRCNGLNIDKMTNERWEAFKKYEIAVDVRSYNLKNLSYWRAEGELKGVPTDAFEFGVEDPINFNSIQFVQKPRVDGFTRWMWCSEMNRCVGIDCCLQRPRYFRCSLPMAWRHIEAKWPETHADSHLIEGVDFFEIDKDYTLDDITKIYTLPACHHCCRGESPLRYSANTVSKHAKEEWVLENDVPLGAGYPEFIYNTPKWQTMPWSCSEHKAQLGGQCRKPCPNKGKEPFEPEKLMKAKIKQLEAANAELKKM